MRPGIGAAAMALVLLGGATACGDNSSSSKSGDDNTFRVAGTIEVVGEGTWSGDKCAGSGGYNDMRAGTGVSVYDASGKAIAIGSLEPGVTMGQDCDFHFVVNDVPIQKGSDIYSVEISHRGKMQFTEAQAATLALTLG